MIQDITIIKDCMIPGNIRIFIDFDIHAGRAAYGNESAFEFKTAWFCARCFYFNSQRRDCCPAASA